jgi:hypothetical protein
MRVVNVKQHVYKIIYSKTTNIRFTYHKSCRGRDRRVISCTILYTSEEPERRANKSNLLFPRRVLVTNDFLKKKMIVITRRT